MEGLLRGLRAPARGAPRARFAGAAGLVLLGEAALCALLVAFVPCARPPPPPRPPTRAVPPRPRRRAGGAGAAVARVEDTELTGGGG